MTLAALLSELHNTSPAWSATFPVADRCRYEWRTPLSGYMLGCRCNRCKAAHTEYQRSDRAKRRLTEGK